MKPTRLQETRLVQMREDYIAIIQVVIEDDGILNVLAVNGVAGGAYSRTRRGYPGDIWITQDEIDRDGTVRHIGMGTYDLVKIEDV